MTTMFCSLYYVSSIADQVAQFWRTHIDHLDHAIGSAET